MTDVVERAKAALEGTTEGPWGTDGELIASELVVERPGVTSYKHAIADMETDYYAEEGAEEGETYGDAEPWRPFEQMEADAEFIAQARTLVPELVAEVERLRKVTDIIDPDSVYREQRDEAQAAVKRLREQVRQMRRQTELFMEDGDRNRLTVALAVSDE